MYLSQVEMAAIAVLLLVIFMIYRARFRRQKKKTQDVDFAFYSYKSDLANLCRKYLDYGFVKSDHLLDAINQDNLFVFLNEFMQELSHLYEIALHALAEKQDELRQHQDSLKFILESNLTSIPFLAGMIADYCTYDYEILAKKLDWGCDVKREKKVRDIRKIRADARQQITAAKVAEYELEYLKSLYPVLDEVLASDYKDIQYKKELPDYDYTKDYLSKEEWSLLNETERNQLALDRYIDSHKKSKWQIGRDYELYCGYLYECKGYSVEYFGSNKGLEDLGRDLIATKDSLTDIVQCKYWSKDKCIHEKHIFQLYGTLTCYLIENNLPELLVRGVFITNITLSDMARNVADRLGIVVKENVPIGDFPRIKCNIGHDEFGLQTRIYHLPMDQQYDKVKLHKKGEKMVFTVKEAEDSGFRRAYRWHSNS